MNKSYLEKYSELIIKVGINIQKNQTLVISSPIECAEFTRIISEIAYKEGAREVVINWDDELSTKIKYLQGKDEIFDEFPQWRKELFVSYARKGAAFLRISASNPELMKDVNPDRLMRFGKASSIALAEYKERMMSDKNVWCVVSIPTKAWAKKVFQGISEDEAIEKLWQAIFEAVRATEIDPVLAWQKHQNNLKKSMDFLNGNNFKYLVYKNSLGTDLKIELPKNHIWLGGSSISAEGTEFVANIPTEEVFTLPLKTGVNGKVVSSKPLNHNGNLIENFSLTFKDGRIIDFTAQKGYETLKALVETDEGSHYLGEVALVPFDSPISNSNILFYNTLFDENASCHLAIGEAYPTCLKNGENMTKDELKAYGVNDSLEHVDFMLGTSDLSIIGITQEGKEIEVFKNGNFSIMSNQKIIRDGHIHSHYCPHGTNDAFELYVDKAIEVGLKEMTFTEHMPLPADFMDPNFMKTCSPTKGEIEEYFKELDSIKLKYKNQIKINTGLEVDYVEGYEDKIKELLNNYGEKLEDSILSVHFVEFEKVYYSVDGSIKEFEKLVKAVGSVEKVYDIYYKTLLKAIKADLGNYKPKRIGHPTLVRIFNTEYPLEYNNIKLLEEIAKEIKLRDYEVDFNTSGLRKSYCKEIYPTGIFEELVKQYNIRIVHGSDAHNALDVGKDFV